MSGEVGRWVAEQWQQRTHGPGWSPLACPPVSTDIRPADIDAFLAEVYPAAHAMGLRCEELGDGMAVGRWPYDPAALRPGGYIPGPTQFALADVALWYAVFTVIGVAPMAVTTDLHISFLRPAVGADLLARARLLRVGKVRAYGTIDLWMDGQPDRLVSHATGTYALPVAAGTQESNRPEPQ